MSPQCGQNLAKWRVWFFYSVVVGQDFGILFWKGEEKVLVVSSCFYLGLVNLKRVMFSFQLCSISGLVRFLISATEEGSEKLLHSF